MKFKVGDIIIGNALSSTYSKTTVGVACKVIAIPKTRTGIVKVILLNEPDNGIYEVATHMFDLHEPYIPIVIGVNNIYTDHNTGYTVEWEYGMDFEKECKISHITIRSSKAKILVCLGIENWLHIEKAKKVLNVYGFTLVEKKPVIFSDILDTISDKEVPENILTILKENKLI